MDNYELALQIAKSLQDARTNENSELVRKLEAELAEINVELAAEGFAPVKAE